RVVAAPAEPPQTPRARPVAGERELRALVPDVDQAHVARAAAAVDARRQRRAAFDRAVGFDAHRVLAGRAALEADGAAAVAAHLTPERAEVADVVGELELDAVANRAPPQRGE